jgi:hypothetical protein
LELDSSSTGLGDSRESFQNSYDFQSNETLAVN